MEYRVPAREGAYHKHTIGVGQIEYILISSNKVTLKELYYEYNYKDILDLFEIILCENYNMYLDRQGIFKKNNRRL